jgi:hypothetical protein
MSSCWTSPCRPPPPEVPRDVAAPPASALRTPSGLRYVVLRPGTGSQHPTVSNRVRVHYPGWSADGEMFDSSVTRGRPTTLGVSQVIQGLTEGLQLMVVGEEVRFWIPADLANGDSSRPGTPAGRVVFDVELIEILWNAPARPGFSSCNIVVAAERGRWGHQKRLRPQQPRPRQSLSRRHGRDAAASRP